MKWCFFGSVVCSRQAGGMCVLVNMTRAACYSTDGPGSCCLSSPRLTFKARSQSKLLPFCLQLVLVKDNGEISWERGSDRALKVGCSEAQADCKECCHTYLRFALAPKNN